MTFRVIDGAGPDAVPVGLLMIVGINLCALRHSRFGMHGRWAVAEYEPGHALNAWRPAVVDDFGDLVEVAP